MIAYLLMLISSIGAIGLLTDFAKTSNIIVLVALAFFCIVTLIYSVIQIVNLGIYGDDSE